MIVQKLFIRLQETLMMIQEKNSALIAHFIAMMIAIAVHLRASSAAS